MASPAVEVRGLTVAYGEVVALDAVSAAFNPGLTLVVGANGSGKSSLLKAIVGAVRPIAGDILIGGKPAHAARAAGAVAYVPQGDAVDYDFPVTVSDVVAMGTYVRRGDSRSTVAAALERAGIAGLGRRQIGELSGGQRRRAFLARAIAQDAPLVILDEPVAGVDVGAQQAFYDVLRTLVDDGRTVVMSTHDLASIPTLADEALLLQQRVIAHGSPKDVVTPEVLARAFGVAT